MDPNPEAFCRRNAELEMKSGAVAVRGLKGDSFNLIRILTFNVAVAALALAGCVDTGSSGSTGSLSISGSTPLLSTVVVGEFIVASDLVVIDHDFSVRLERRAGQYSIP